MHYVTYNLITKLLLRRDYIKFSFTAIAVVSRPWPKKQALNTLILELHTRVLYHLYDLLSDSNILIKVTVITYRCDAYLFIHLMDPCFHKPE